MAEAPSWDMIVVGGGLAGLTTAARAAELGLRVAVLEQGDGERYACNSRFTGGIFHVGFLDVRRPPHELTDAVRRITNGFANPVLAEAVAADAHRFIRWLEEHGARFMRFSALEAHRWCLAPPRRIAAGLAWQGCGPDVVLRRLTEHLQANKGTLLLGVRARSLRFEHGHCAGVIGSKGGSDFTATSSAVVIADGGHQANAELFRAHVGPRPDRVLQRGAGNSRGDGLKMAEAAGAAVTDLGALYGHVLCRDALTNDRVWPYPDLDAIVTAGIVVGPDGMRLFDEGSGGVAAANHLARLDDPASATAILDTEIWQGPGTSGRIPANPYLERFGGTVHRADTLAGLAAKAGLPADRLIETVANYNAAVDSGRLAQLMPTRSTGTIKAWPIRVGPFLAIPACAGITHTMGGMAIDGDAQVLRPDHSVIPGLFAAGTVIGGLDGGPSYGYVGGLIKAVFGMRAAETAARLAAR